MRKALAFTLLLAGLAFTAAACKDNPKATEACKGSGDSESCNECCKANGASGYKYLGANSCGCLGG